MTTDFSKLFQLRLPLVLAPLAGGGSTPELAAAVCNAGGLGSLGSAYSKPADIEREAARLRELSSRPFLINLFVPCKDPVLTEEQIQKALSATRGFRQELQIPEPTLKAPFSDDFDKQFESVLRIKPAAFSFTFGVLGSEYISACHKAGIYTIGTATTLEEALELEEVGVNSITLQGVEAGGHRGIFDLNSEDPQVSALDLTKTCSQRIKLPLITAGGIMNGQDIKKALQAGAQAAQMGTAFLTCDESGISAPYRRELLKTTHKETKLTRVFSGRIARGIENRFMKEMEGKMDSVLPFPAQNVFTRDLRKASAAVGSSEFLSLWAGTGADSIRSMKAAELVSVLIEELS
ncbi:Nitronate monooxygenase [compost metagenome]